MYKRSAFFIKYFNPKAVLLLLCLWSCLEINLTAQEVAPFSFKDQKGLAVNKKNMPLLTSKTWTTYKQYIIKKDEANAHPGSFMTLKFLPNGTFQSTIGNRGFTGTWKMQNKRSLNVQIAEQKEPDQEAKMTGDYTIYKLEEGELVLVKDRKSEPDAGMIYYCKASKTSVLAENPVTFAAKQSGMVDPKALEETRRKQEQLHLVSEIETEAQLRGIKIKENLNKMDAKALQALKKQILSGKYGTM